MAEKINTGKYRIRKEIIGQSKTRETIEEFNNLEECQSIFQKIIIADNYVYYIEEETYYRGTQKDFKGNPIDSIPGWTRFYE